MSPWLNLSGRRAPEGGAPVVWDALRRGAGHPVTRRAAVALLQALAAHLGGPDAGRTGARTCGCRRPVIAPRRP